MSPNLLIWLVAMGRLTTHILNSSHGKPAAGLWIEVLKEGSSLTSTVTNSEGRCDNPLLEGDALTAGTYELHFHVGDYFTSLGVDSPFLDIVPVRFRVEEGQSYHVPLVCSPYAYSTYRGS